MWTHNQRIISRLIAYVIANVGFLIIQRREGWLVAFAISFLATAARVLARADAEKAVRGV